MADLESVIMSSIADLPGREPDGGGNTNDPVDDGSAEAEGHEPGADDDGNEVEAAGAEDDAEPVADPAEPVAADDDADPLEDPFAKEFGLTEPKPGQRENRVPYTRVKAIATNAQKKTFTALTGETVQPNETLDQAVTRVGTELKNIREEHGNFKQRVSEMDMLDRLAEERPEQFVQLLFQTNPELKTHALAALGGQSVLDAQNPTVTQLGPKPGPDIELDNGAKTYSVEQLEKLQEWQYQRALIEARKENDKRLEPFERERKSKEYSEQKLTTIRQNLAIAATWEGFDANQTEILAAVKADKTSPNSMMALINSYLKVVLPKYKADREVMRKELLAELKKAPAATSIKGARVAAKTVTPKNDADAAAKTGDLEDVIRASLKNIPGR